MADKKITDLPVAGTLTDDGLLVVYQDEKTESIKGSLVKEYAVAAAKEQADAAAESANAASASKTAAEEAATAVESAKEAAAESASAALAAQGKAQESKNAAEAAAAAAGASVSAVQEAKTAAEEAQSKAEAAQQGAITAQAAAESAKSGADASRDSAETAKVAAETAQADAEAAKTAAQTAKEAAETAKAGAEEAKTGAETARQAIENLGVSAETGEPGAEATVQKTVSDTGSVNLKFTLPRGKQGPKGEQGGPGEQGEPGTPGTDGKSAYQQAQEAGYTGTEAEFNAALAKTGSAMQKTDYDADGAVSKAGGIKKFVGSNFLSLEGGNVNGGVSATSFGTGAFKLYTDKLNTTAVEYVAEGTIGFFCPTGAGPRVKFWYDADEDEIYIELQDDAGTPGIRLKGIAAPKEDGDAVNLATVRKLDESSQKYIDSKVDSLTSTLPLNGWTGNGPYSNKVTVSGILDTDSPIVDIVQSGFHPMDVRIRDGWSNVYRITTGAGNITAYASAKPTIDIPIQLKVVR